MTDIESEDTSDGDSDNGTEDGSGDTTDNDDDPDNAADNEEAAVGEGQCTIRPDVINQLRENAPPCNNEDATAEDLATLVAMLFDSVDSIYKEKARNILVIDVPPVDHAPALIDNRDAYDLQNHIPVWNERLRAAARSFVDDRPDLSLVLFSSHKLFSDMLSEPEDFGFLCSDKYDANGKIWTSDENLIVSQQVHRLLAEKLDLAISLIETPH